MSCSTDQDCLNTQYCDNATHVCMDVQESTRVCYRSEECSVNKFCGKPGATVKPTCATCPAVGKDHSTNQAGLNIHGCNCNGALYCNNCDEAGYACQDCVKGYEKVGTKCIKTCTEEEVATHECQCKNQATCQVGFICRVVGEVPTCVAAAIDCKIDQYCAECDSTNDKKCSKCVAGYELNELNKCVVERTCKTGSTAITHCIKCDDNNKVLCGQCDVNFDLVDNVCVAKSCTSFIEHCTTCSFDETKCTHCEFGYTVEDGLCVVVDNPCRNDYDCGDDNSKKYCSVATQQCVDYEPSNSVCYRTSECINDKEYCKTPGKSSRTSCGICTSNGSTVDFKTCKCGTAVFCAACDDTQENKVCKTCIAGYEMAGGVCTKPCDIDVALTAQCSCKETLCVSGQTCTVDGCIGVGDTDTCLVGPSHVQHCVECETADKKKCARCDSGYTLQGDGSCAQRSDCQFGDAAIANCISCKESNKNECAECDPKYHLVNNVCVENTCLEGPSKVEHCIACIGNTGQCAKCEGDLVIHENKCVQRTQGACGNDYDCKSTEYCTIQHECMPYEESSSVCYRTEHCKGNNKLCSTPGKTSRGSCGSCTTGKWADMLEIKTCQCGTAVFCKYCTDDGTDCNECLTNYEKVENVCTKGCDLGVVPQGAHCACGGVICPAGETCQQNSDMSKTCSSKPIESDCLSGAGKIAYCIECDPNNKKQCHKCDDSHYLVDNSCHVKDDCVYGDRRVPDCEECADLEPHTCAKCRKGFVLTDNTCSAAMSTNKTGLIVGCTVGAVAVVVIAIIVAVVIIRKRKVNGTVKQDTAGRKRNVEVPDEVHIPI